MTLPGRRQLFFTIIVIVPPIAGGLVLFFLSAPSETGEGGAFVRDVERLSGLEVTVFRGGRRLASTLPGVRGSPERGAPEQSRDFTAGGRDYRGRVDEIREPAGPPAQVAVFKRADDLSQAI